MEKAYIIVGSYTHNVANNVGNKEKKCLSVDPNTFIILQKILLKNNFDAVACQFKTKKNLQIFYEMPQVPNFYSYVALYGQKIKIVCMYIGDLGEILI